jgi:hypothetical protein
MFNSEKLSSITFSRQAANSLCPDLSEIIRYIDYSDWHFIIAIRTNKHEVFPHSTIGLQLINDIKEE